MGEQRHPVTLGDDVTSACELTGRQLAQGAGAPLELRQLERDGGRRTGQGDELGMGVREARTGRSALVDERVQVRKPDRLRVACASLPRLRHQSELIGRQLRERAHVSRGVDHHLLPLEGRIPVGDDPHLPR